MGMSASVIKKFVEEDHKDEVIMVTCDNQHIFYHNAHMNLPIIWDWDNELLIAIEPNDEAIDQNKHPMQITQVSFDEIQYLTAYIDRNAAIKFINENITDEAKKEEAKVILQKVAPGVMGPKTLQGKDLGRF